MPSCCHPVYPQPIPDLCPIDLGILGEAAEVLQAVRSVADAVRSAVRIQNSERGLEM